MLDCGRSKIYELLREGRLKSVHYDNAQRVTVKSILELVESEGVAATAVRELAAADGITVKLIAASHQRRRTRPGAAAFLKPKTRAANAGTTDGERMTSTTIAPGAQAGQFAELRAPVTATSSHKQFCRAIRALVVEQWRSQQFTHARLAERAREVSHAAIEEDGSSRVFPLLYVSVY